MKLDDFDQIKLSLNCQTLMESEVYCFNVITTVTDWIIDLEDLTGLGINATTGQNRHTQQT